MAERILHQADVESVIEELIDENDTDQDAAVTAEIAAAVEDLEDVYVAQGATVIATPSAPGATYDQTEVASLKTAIDAIRAVLIASGITAAA